jgi:phosphatidylinositol alpha-1,6-mannosyltransferase
MKKVAFIAVDFAPNVGGIAQYTYGILNRLSADQIMAIALPTSGWQSFDEHQSFLIQRIKLPSRWQPFNKIFKFLAPLFFLKLLKTPDIKIVACCQSHHALLLAAWLLRKIKHIPFCVFIYGNDILIPQNKRSRDFHNYLLKSANMVVAISKKTKNLALEIGVEPEKLHLLPPCIEPGKFIQKQISSQNLSNLNQQNKSIMLTVGRLVERKGQDMVLRALPTVLKSIPDLHYVIVGTGDDEDRLKLLVDNLYLSDVVTFAGYVPDEKLPAYYDACKLFIMVSREITERGDLEGFGIVYLEANLMGKPVIAGASGGVGDAVVDGETGLLVDPNNIDDIADAIIYLLKDEETAVSMGQNGKKRVLQEFTCEVLTKRFSALLRDHFNQF